MKDKIGKLNSGLVWVFALAAILLGIGGAWATAGLGAKASAGTYFGIFAVMGFLSTFLTRSKTGIGVLAFVIAAVGSAAIYYAVASGFVTDATAVVASAASGGTASAEATQAGSAVGSAFGVFAAAITFVVSLVAGIGGCVVGARQRRRVLAAG